MGAKTWMLVYADANVGETLKSVPQLDREATLRRANTLFSADKLEAIGDGSLSWTCPPDDEVHVACFPGVSILAAKEFAIDYPSRLPRSFVAAGGSGTIYLLRCTALLIGLHTRSGLTVSWFGRSACPRTAAS